MTAPQNPPEAKSAKGSATPVIGRPPITPEPSDIEKIETMAGLGLTQNKMARILGWSEDTFTRRKQDDARVLRAIEEGQAKAELQVARSLYEKAVGGETAAIRWYEITRCGRSERTREVEPGEDYPGMDEILNMSTDEKIADLKNVLRRYPAKAKTNGNGNGNGRGK